VADWDELEEANRVIEWERTNHALGRPVNVGALFDAFDVVLGHSHECEAQVKQIETDLTAAEGRRDELEKEKDRLADRLSDLQSSIDSVVICLEDQITALNDAAYPPTADKPKGKP